MRRTAASANAKVLLMNATSLDNAAPRYQCVRCGNCCRWPGDVNVTRREVTAIAAYLGMDEQEFIDEEVIQAFAREGLLALTIPTEYGGLGLSASAYARVFGAVA